MLVGTVATLVLVAVGVYGSQAVVLRWLPTASRAERWLAAALVGAWTTTAGFHILSAFNGFRLWVAVPLWLVMALVARAVTRLPLRRVAEIVAGDASDAARAAWGPPAHGEALHLAAWAYLRRLLCVGLPAAVVTRALLLPPLGWDGITYHAVKSAMWVQTGGSLPLVTPGGWFNYRLYPGGGEIPNAWTMLLWHSDTLTGLCEAAQWLMLWPALHVLARRLCVPGELHRPLAAFLAGTPAIAHAVGGAYVEVTLYLYLLAGLALLLRALELLPKGAPEGVPTAFLALVGLALAAGVKVTAVLFPIAGAVVVCIACWRGRTPAARSLVLVMAAAAAGAVVVLPWQLHAMIETGYPLSPYPVEVAGLTLGEVSPVLEWYQHRPDLGPGALHEELRALGDVFGLRNPSRPFGSDLGPLSLLFVVLLPLTAAAGLRRRRAATLVLLAFAAVQMAMFYSADFAVVRLLWSTTAARFLYLFGAVAALLAAAACPGPRACRIMASLLWGSTAFWYLSYLADQPASFEWPALGAGVACALSGAAMLHRFRERPRIVAAALALLAAAGPPALDRIRSEVRWPAAAESVVYHQVPRYWRPWAEAVDDPGIPRRLAIAAGPLQNGDNELMYYFMGSRLQNSLVHIPAAPDGELVPFGSDARALILGWGPMSWLQGVAEEEVDFVVALFPPGPESFWMGRLPELFRPVVGDASGLGVYEVNKELVAAHRPRAPAGLR